MSAVYQLANPCHPGAFLRHKVFEPRNLTIMGAAATLGVTRQSLCDLLGEKISLTADMAFRLEKAFGYDMEMLLDMQKHFDIAAIRKRERSSGSASVAKAWSQVAASRLQVAKARAPMANGHAAG